MYFAVLVKKSYAGGWLNNCNKKQEGTLKKTFSNLRYPLTKIKPMPLIILTWTINHHVNNQCRLKYEIHVIIVNSKTHA